LTGFSRGWEAVARLVHAPGRRMCRCFWHSRAALCPGPAATRPRAGQTGAKAGPFRGVRHIYRARAPQHVISERVWQPLACGLQQP